MGLNVARFRRSVISRKADMRGEKYLSFGGAEDQPLARRQ
jgi:hypothetical protein